MPPSQLKEDSDINLVERYKPLGIMAVRAATEIKPRETSPREPSTPAKQRFHHGMSRSNEGNG